MSEIQSNPSNYGIDVLHIDQLTEPDRKCVANYYSFPKTINIYLLYPDTWRDFTIDNFWPVYRGWSYETNGGYNTYNDLVYTYDNTTGVFTYNPPWNWISGGHPEPTIQFYLVY